MTEQEWLEKDEPLVMIDFLLDNYYYFSGRPFISPVNRDVLERKCQLVVNACQNHGTSPPLYDYGPDGSGISFAHNLTTIVREWCGVQQLYDPPKEVKADLIRHIFGNPFRRKVGV